MNKEEIAALAHSLSEEEPRRPSFYWKFNLTHYRGEEYISKQEQEEYSQYVEKRKGYYKKSFEELAEHLSTKELFSLIRKVVELQIPMLLEEAGVTTRKAKEREYVDFDIRIRALVKHLHKEGYDFISVDAKRGDEEGWMLFPKAIIDTESKREIEELFKSYGCEQIKWKGRTIKTDELFEYKRFSDPTSYEMHFTLPKTPGIQIDEKEILLPSIPERRDMATLVEFGKRIVEMEPPKPKEEWRRAVSRFGRPLVHAMHDEEANLWSNRVGTYYDRMESLVSSLPEEQLKYIEVGIKKAVDQDSKRDSMEVIGKLKDREYQDIDREIRPLIRELHDSGFITLGSCAGHKRKIGFVSFPAEEVDAVSKRGIEEIFAKHNIKIRRWARYGSENFFVEFPSVVSGPWRS